MPNHRHNTSEFHHFTEGRGNDRRIVQLKRDGPWNVECRCKFTQNHVSEYFGAIIVILLGVFDETEAVDVTHEGFATGARMRKRKFLSN